MLLYIYKENKNIEDIDLESNFLQNSENIRLEENLEPQIREFLSPYPKKLKKRPSNKRKSPLWHRQRQEFIILTSTKSRKT